jgi:hypothetical protein
MSGLFVVMGGGDEAPRSSLRETTTYTTNMSVKCKALEELTQTK